MKPLNYSRHLISQYSSVPIAQLHEVAREYMSKLSKAVKFMLPDGGRLIDDIEYRGICEGRLNLPYDVVAFEYHDSRPQETGLYPVEKRIVLAFQDETFIYVAPAFTLRTAPDKWMPLPPAYMPRDGAFSVEAASGNQGRVPFRLIAPAPIPASDYADEAIAMLSTLNALSCSNVRDDVIEPSRFKQSIAKDRRALPYDSYHFLTLEVPSRKGSSGEHGGTHRSPREHLRRGHIRRLEDGRRIWVNAAVINAGVGASVSKDYGLRAAS